MSDTDVIKTVLKAFLEKTIIGMNPFQEKDVVYRECYHHLSREEFRTKVFCGVYSLCQELSETFSEMIRLIGFFPSIVNVYSRYIPHNPSLMYEFNKFYIKTAETGDDAVSFLLKEYYAFETNDRTATHALVQIDNRIIVDVLSGVMYPVASIVDIRERATKPGYYRWLLENNDAQWLKTGFHSCRNTLMFTTREYWDSVYFIHYVNSDVVPPEIDTSFVNDIKFM